MQLIRQNPPPADPLQLVIMGLLGLGLGRGKNRKRIEKNRKNPKVGKQKQTEQANKQTNKNTDGCPTRTTPKEKCIICKGPHSNLMFCPKLTHSTYLLVGIKPLQGAFVLSAYQPNIGMQKSVTTWIIGSTKPNYVQQLRSIS